jgi:anti-anti-sigma regulatory factor
MVVEMSLKGCQDVRVAAQLQTQLIESTSRSKCVVVQCDDITEMDASTIQLLLAAKKDSGNQFRLEASPTSDCLRWFGLAGVSDRLLGTNV